jgi:hypothetical protein
MKEITLQLTELSELVQDAFIRGQCRAQEQNDASFKSECKRPSADSITFKSAVNPAASDDSPGIMPHLRDVAARSAQGKEGFDWFDIDARLQESYFKGFISGQAQGANPDDYKSGYMAALKAAAIAIQMNVKGDVTLTEIEEHYAKMVHRTGPEYAAAAKVDPSKKPKGKSKHKGRPKGSKNKPKDLPLIQKRNKKN